MNRLIFLTMPLSFLSLPASAGTVAFGTGGNQFNMEFVDVGNAGNGDSGSGFGGVSYNYQMGKYEVSRDMITKASSEGSLGLTMADMSSFGGNGENRPATGISWNEAARFVNWLNTSQGHQPAYQFTTGGSNDSITLWSTGDAWQIGGENLFRHKDAYYFIPSEDEWYKAAYHGPAGAFFAFATGSDTAPTAVASGTGAGTAVYLQGFATGPADITNAGGLSPYGTMAQSGNVYEWAESGFFAPNDSAGESRLQRGGGWSDPSGNLLASPRFGAGPSDKTNILVGFRVAAIPEPTMTWFVLLGAIGLMARRRH